MIGAPDPGTDPRLALGDDMFCGCGGLGVVTDAAPLAAGLSVVTWYTEHARGCAGRSCPERSFVMDLSALAAGDVRLPGLPERPRRQCEAVASTTGRRCRNRAGLSGRCGQHDRPPDSQAGTS